MTKIMNNLTSNAVRVRIAPSPTGFPHIGTIYQAFFDFAFARKHNGRFLVRIEDTDQKRFVEGAEEKIYEALDWFGLTEDESPRKGGKYKPYRQSERLPIYKKYAEELAAKGFAYYCDCSQERLAQVRDQLQKEKKIIMYDKHCRALGKTSGVVRLKIPLNKKIIVHDEIRGDIEFDSSTVDDQVLLKSDGFSTYHLASTVDDHLMKITHVVRGEEWITSFPKHQLLYEYFGWEKPLFFHTADLRNPDKSKLSKRHGHTNVSWYQEQGFLPEAILNFLALLGWSHPEEKEIFSLDEFIKYFELKDIKPVAPIFDIKKLEWMNGVYIRKSQISNLKSQILDRNKKLKNADSLLLDKLIHLAQTRMKTLSDFTILASHFFREPKIKLNQKEKKIGEKLIKYLSTIEQWNNEKILEVMKYLMGRENISMPVIYKILTGKDRGLPLPQSLEILGKEKVLARLKKQV